jgi:hypothetical protein
VVAAAEHGIAPGHHSGQPDRRRDRLGPGLYEADPLEPGDRAAEIGCQRLLQHRRERTDHALLCGLGDRAGDLGMTIAQRHGAEAHDVVQVLAAFAVPHPAAGRTRHPERQRLARGAEQGGGALAAGRGDAGDAVHQRSSSTPKADGS